MTSFDYKNYWDTNYANKGTSGAGSYGVLGDFKADVIKNLIDKYSISSTIDFGCGDGNMVKLIDYDNYIGFDIAPSAVERCKGMFENDNRKAFYVYDPITFEGDKYKADMVVCLDVLYHITVKEDFVATLDAIFNTASKLVVIYTILSKEYKEFPECPSIVDRDIYLALEKYKNFKLVDTINQNLGSRASFLIFERIN